MYKTSAREFNTINVTPLVDVMLVLLVVLLLVSHITKYPDHVIHWSTPGDGTARDTTPVENVPVRVSDTGIAIRGVPVRPPTSLYVERALMELKRNAPAGRDIVLTVEPTPNAVHKHVVTVFDAAIGAGIPHVRVATEPPP